MTFTQIQKYFARPPAREDRAKFARERRADSLLDHEHHALLCGPRVGVEYRSDGARREILASFHAANQIAKKRAREVNETEWSHGDLNPKFNHAMVA